MVLKTYPSGCLDAQKALPILIAIFQGGWRAVGNTRLVNLPQILVETKKCPSWKMGKKTCGNHHIDPPRLVNSCDSCLISFWRPTVSHKSEDKFRVKTRDRIKPAELGLFGLFFIQQFHLSYCPIRKKTPRVCHRMIDENSSSIYRYIDIDIYI